MNSPTSNWVVCVHTEQSKGSSLLMLVLRLITGSVQCFYCCIASKPCGSAAAAAVAAAATVVQRELHAHFKAASRLKWHCQIASTLSIMTMHSLPVLSSAHEPEALSWPQCPQSAHTPPAGTNPGDFSQLWRFPTAAQEEVAPWVCPTCMCNTGNT